MNASEQELIDSKVGLKNALSRVKGAITVCERELSGTARKTTLAKLQQAKSSLTETLAQVNRELRRAGV